MPSWIFWPAAVFGSTALFVIPVVGQSAAAQPIGIVERVSAGWIRAQDQRLLLATDLVYLDDTILLDRARVPSATSGSVAVLMLATGQLWEKNCTVAAPCDGSFRPPQPTTSTGFWVFLKSFWSSPDKKLDPRIVSVRGLGDASPTHALLERSNGLVDFRPALERLPRGSYLLTFAPAAGLSPPDDEPAKVVPVDVAANPGPVTAIMSTGLYVLTVTTASGESVGNSAVILVVDGGGVAQSTWRRAKAESEAWSGVSRTTIDGLLARVLYALATESPGR